MFLIVCLLAYYVVGNLVVHIGCIVLPIIIICVLHFSKMELDRRYIVSFVAFVSRLGPLAARLRQNQVPVFTLMLQALRNFFIVFPIFIAAAFFFSVLSCLPIRSVTIFTSRRTTGILSDFAIRAPSCPISPFSRHRCARCLPTGLHVSLSSVFLLLGTSADSSI